MHPFPAKLHIYAIGCQKICSQSSSTEVRHPCTRPTPGCDYPCLNQYSSTAGGPEGVVLQIRSEYMERILRHTIPDLELDVDSLRRKAESLTIAEGSTQAPSRDTASESEIETDLNIENENCTIEAVNDTDTVARMCLISC